MMQIHNNNFKRSWNSLVYYDLKRISLKQITICIFIWANQADKYYKICFLNFLERIILFWFKNVKINYTLKSKKIIEFHDILFNTFIVKKNI